MPSFLKKSCYVALLGLGLVGCSGVETKIPPTRLSDFSASVVPAVQWNARVPASKDGFFKPAISMTEVLATGRSGEVVAIERYTGAARTLLQTGETLSSGVGYLDGRLFLGTDKGRVLAFEQSGQPVWQTRLMGEVIATPVAESGVVVVRTGDGRISGLSAEDGHLKWQFHRQLPALLLRAPRELTLFNGLVFAGLSGGRLVALNLQGGEVVWETAVAQSRGATEMERLVEMIGRPEVGGGQVCAVAFQGKIACYSLKNGSLLWTRELSSTTGLTLSEHAVYVTDEEGAVWAFERETGRNLWRQTGLRGRQTSAPTVLGKHILVSDYQGMVHLLDSVDGRFVGRLSTDGSPLSIAPQTVGETTYLQTTSGQVWALRLP